MKNKEVLFRALAKHFSASKRFVSVLIQLYRKTGDVTPRLHAGGRVPVPEKNDGYQQLILFYEARARKTMDREASYKVYQMVTLEGALVCFQRCVCRLTLFERCYEIA